MRFRLGTLVAALGLLAACSGPARADWTAWSTMVLTPSGAPAITNWGFTGSSQSAVNLTLPQSETQGVPVGATLLTAQVELGGQLEGFGRVFNNSGNTASYDMSVSAYLIAYDPGTSPVEGSPFAPAGTLIASINPATLPYTFSNVAPGTWSPSETTWQDLGTATPAAVTGNVTGTDLAAWTGNSTVLLPVAAKGGVFLTGPSGSANFNAYAIATAKVRYEYSQAPSGTPEPGSMALLGVGMAVAGFAKKRRKKA